ncbi:MAG: ABC transporter permease [Eubacteriales bacterium]|nr:ABC transporter permease [Eubacteriales bacterium]
MKKGLCALIKKDFRLLLSSKFLLLAAGSLILYSSYINFVYINIEQENFSVYLYDPYHLQERTSSVKSVGSREELEEKCSDGNSVGIHISGKKPEIYMISSGIKSIDDYRTAYAISALSPGHPQKSLIVGGNSKEMKMRREITAEFLFFELSAVGFLGLAAMLFKEKQMGVVRVYGIMPVRKSSFILSKAGLFLVSDLVFAALLTLINLGFSAGVSVLPGVLVQAGILSLVMAFTGFICAVVLPGFRQFSMLYLVLAVFITTPVFLAGQTGITWEWIKFHPMYHMFKAMKDAYFHTSSVGYSYYITCGTAIILLFLFACRGLSCEMKREG